MPRGEASCRRAIPVSRGHDAAGRYDYALPAGRLDLVVRAARIGYQPGRVDGFDLTSEVTHELALRLEPGLALELRLADGLPELPREVTILLLEERAASQVRTPIDATGANWEGHSDLSGPAVSDRRLRMWSSDGSARVNGLPPGRLRLCAFPDELVFEPATIELSTDGPRTVELRWQPRASGK